MKTVELNLDDVADLAATMLKMDGYEDESDVDGLLFEQYALDLEQFAAIVAHLLPMIDVGTSGLTGKRYKGFATDGFFHVKQEIV